MIYNNYFIYTTKVWGQKDFLIDGSLFWKESFMFTKAVIILSKNTVKTVMFGNMRF